MEFVDPINSRKFKHHAIAEQRASRSFATGFDLFTEEEMEKRQQRAARFNLPTDGGLQWTGGEVAEDEQKRRQRAERFGTQYTQPTVEDSGLMDVDLYEDRKEAPVEVERRSNAVHIYGVDLLSTKDLLSYFADYGPKYIEWINDSSANVVFEDGGTSKRALVGMGEPMPSDDLPEGASLSDPQAMQYVWHKGKDFRKAGTDIPLVFRMATILDVKPAERVKSRRLWVGLGDKGSRGRRNNQRGKFGGRHGPKTKGFKKKFHKGGHDRNVHMRDVEDDARGRGLVRYDDL